MKSYIINILTISAILSIVAFLLFYFALQQYYLHIFPVIILVFIATNVVVYSILTKAGKKSIRQFSTYFMGSVGLKLFIYMIFIIIYSVSNKHNAVNFVIQFFALYVVYTIYETRAIIKTLNKQGSQKTNNTNAR